MKFLSVRKQIYFSITSEFCTIPRWDDQKIKKKKEKKESKHKTGRGHIPNAIPEIKRKLCEAIMRAK